MGGGVVDAANSRAQKLLLIFCDDDEKKGKIFRPKKKERSLHSFVVVAFVPRDRATNTTNL